jgi:hypothetical protein
MDMPSGASEAFCVLQQDAAVRNEALQSRQVIAGVAGHGREGG